MIVALSEMRNVKCSKCGDPMVTSQPKSAARTLFTCAACRELDETGVRRPPQTVPPAEPELNSTPRWMSEQKFSPKRRPPWVGELVAKLEVHLTAGRWEIAIGLLNLERQRSPQERRAEYLRMPVSDLDLDTRTVGILQRAGIETLGKLARCSDNDIRNSGVHWQTLPRIKECLAALGIKRRP